MRDFLLGAAVVVLLTVGLGWLRAIRGPTDADRVMAVQLIGSGGVGALLLIQAAVPTAGTLDVALSLALLGAFTVAAFARSGPGGDDSDRRAGSDGPYGSGGPHGGDGR